MLSNSTLRVNSFSGSWPISTPDIDVTIVIDIDVDFDTDGDPSETMILTEEQILAVRDEAKAYVEDEYLF